MTALSSLLTAYQEHLDRGGAGSAEEFLHLHPGAPPEALPALRAVADLRAAGPLPVAGDRVGSYRIGRELGRGAQATVYLAEDTRLSRMVALKILAPPRGSEAAFYLRFRREAETASRLDHRGVCSVHEMGVTGGRAFIAMRYLEGGTLRRVIDAGPPCDRASLLERVRCVEEVARALHYAHERGAVHRDIKPGNIMLASDGVPVLCDFGLVHLTEGEPGLTRTGEIHGTPLYMAPEQVRGESPDRRWDVYSLGAVLYELVAGRRPHEGVTWLESCRLILRSDPPSPRALNRHVPKELEAILLTALDKQPARRYATAHELAEDLRRLRAHEPVRARRPGALLRARRWCQRHPAKAIALFLVVGGAIVITLLQQASLARVSAAKRESDRLREQANWETYRSRIAAAGASIKGLEAGEAQRQLELCAPGLRSREWEYLFRKADTSLEQLVAHAAPITAASMSEDGRRLATASEDKTIVVRELPSLRPVVTIRTAPPGTSYYWARAYAVALNADGRLVAEGSETGVTRVWRTDDGSEVLALRGLARPTEVVHFLAGGSRLFTAGRQGAEVWEVATGERVERFAASVHCAAVARDERRFLGGAADGWLVEGRFGTAAIRRVLRCTSAIHVVGAVEAETALVGLDDGVVLLVDTARGRVVTTLRGHRDRVSGVAVAGREALTAGHDGTLRRWRLDTGELLETQIGHGGHITALLPAPDGAAFWTGSLDGTVRRWTARPRAAERVLLRAPDNLEAAALSPDGLRAATGGWDGIGRVVDVVTGDPVAVLRGHTSRLHGLAFHPDGRRIASASSDRTVRLWDAASGELLTILRGHSGTVESLAFSADGARIVTGSKQDRTIRIFDVERGTQLVVIPAGGPVTGVSCGPRGGSIAATFRGGAVRFWADPTAEAVELAGARTATAVAFHPDGRLLATGELEGGIILWDLETFQRIRHLTGHVGSVSALRFDPGGRRLVSAGRDQRLLLWDFEQGEPVLVLRGHEGLVADVDFSADGARIVSAGHDRTLRLWEFRPPLGAREAAERRAALVDRVGPLVDRLFEETGFSLDVAHRLAGDASLVAEERQQAMRLALSREESAAELGDAAWEIAARPGLPRSEYVRAVELVRRAMRLRPAVRQVLPILGAALYRAGDLEEARRVLERHEEMHLRDPRYPRPESVAFLAMAFQRLGHAAEARAAFATLLDRMKGPRDGGLGDSVALVEEARVLIEG